MPFLELNDAKIYYEDHGQGEETIVFAHSMLFNLRMFDDQIEFLKSNYRCILFDFRGQGKSEVTSAGYDLESLSRDAQELIISLNCKPCHFVGFSMGGMVAMLLAIGAPELFKSMILIDTSSEPEPPGAQSRNKMMLIVAKFFGLKPIVNKVIKMFFGPSFLQDPDRQGLRTIWKNHFLSNDRTGLVRAVKGVLFRKGFTADLHKIKTPTLILWGDHDHLTDRDRADILQSNISNSTLKVIPRAGHMSPVEEPEFVNKAILDFLKTL
jgi:3-oxoadipate enol-lactonase